MGEKEKGEGTALQVQVGTGAKVILSWLLPLKWSVQSKQTLKQGFNQDQEREQPTITNQQQVRAKEERLVLSAQK